MQILHGQSLIKVLGQLHHHQKHVARIINLKDRFTHAQPLLHDMKALDIFKQIYLP